MPEIRTQPRPVIVDGSPDVPDLGDVYLHCAECLDEWRELFAGAVTPKSYARQQASITADGRRLQVWCVRHERNIGVFELEAPTDGVN